MSITYTKKELSENQLEFVGVLPYEEFLAHEQNALEKISKTLEIDGFRKGAVPVSVAKQHIQDLVLLEAMAEEALMKAYGDIITTHAPNAIGRPEITITKIARDNPLEFKVVVSVLPEIKLPDYKKIAKEENEINNKAEEIVITDEEIDKSLDELRKLRTKMNKNKEAENVVEGESKEDGEVKEEDQKDETLPELNDEFAKSFGEEFKTLGDLKDKIRQNMFLEKKLIKDDKVRVKIAEKIIEGVQISLPEIIIEAELERMKHQMESELVQGGLNFEDYLKNLGKTLEDIKTEWRPSAEKRVKLQLALDEIAKLEDIKPNEDKINLEVAQLKAYYKDIDESRAKIYVESQLKNEAVFAFLNQQ